MIIVSENRATTLEIVLNDPSDPYSDYTFRVIVKDDRNPFSGQNDSVQFSAFDSFLRRFADFIKNHEGVAALEMTEDCRLEFFRWNARGDVGVRAQVTKYGFSTDSERANRFRLDVEFKVDGEFANQMYQDFVSVTAA
jgi:hypothetical protein